MGTKHLVIWLGIAAVLAMNTGGALANPNDAPGVKTMPAPGAKSAGSGMTSQPPDHGIGGNNPGSRSSTTGQGTSIDRSSTVGQRGGSGNSGGNDTGSSGDPTGSGAPGTGATQPLGKTGQ